MSEKKKIKFSIVDLIIILVVLAVGAFAVKKLMSFEPPAKHVDVKMTIMQEKLLKDQVPEFKAGDKIYVTDVSNESAGTVLDVRKRTTKTVEVNQNTGEYVESESPIYDTLEVDVETGATEDDVNIECGDTTLKVGMEVVIKGENGSLLGTIMSLDYKE